ncbi:uncharacterized protein METZ01_LOCUS186827 [marine metagenome]|jgi:hypothetical protein|uniref:Uncharacterized protein n=1 Tax=marine metagenome TaxID=408172 RepID=A0A382D8N6_9ZZZZ|tara:strand:+ start:431 stop:541 length:111 start_codon:yes stop_codon:yes gene_type:complete
MFEQDFKNIDDVDELGEVTSIRELFINFQKHLFEAA